MRILFATALAALLPAVLHAEPLTFGDALRLAESQAPEVKAREAGVGAAE